MIIALTGYSRSGKGEVAKYLCEELGFTELNFADPLKKATAELFGWPLIDMYDQKAKAKIDPVYGITPRVALQQLGTDIMREHFAKMPGWSVGKDFWLKRFEQSYKAMADVNSDVVVSDTRFQNECDLVNSLGGQVYMVQRDVVTPADLSMVHPSERVDLLTGITGIIKNNGSIAELRALLEYGNVLKIAMFNGQWVADTE